MVLRTGPIQATVMATTFVLTILIPLQYAVLIGVGLSVVLYVIRQSNRVRVTRWVFSDDGAVTETVPPAELAKDELVVLRPYGSLFFAAAAAFEEALPRVGQGAGGVVIITLRGKEDLGSTFINVIARYAVVLRRDGGQLMLAGVSESVYQQLVKTGVIAVIGEGNVFRATAGITESTRQAMAAAADRDEPEQR